MKLFKEILSITAIIIVIGAIYFLTHNFDINNLKVVSRKESAYMINQGLFSKDKSVTNLGIVVAKHHYKIKEIQDGINKRGIERLSKEDIK